MIVMFLVLWYLSGVFLCWHYWVKVCGHKFGLVEIVITIFTASAGLGLSINYMFGPYDYWKRKKWD